jgi:hypothetical protein
LTTNLAIVCILTMIIHAAETLSYSIRYAGVKLNKIVVALSLTGIVVLVSRTANMLQAPMTATFIDPQLGLITERALHQEKSRQQLGKIYILLMGARFVGTLAAQVIILPAAYLIATAVQWI